MSIKRLLGGFLALVALLAGLGYTHYLAIEHGIQKGVDAYHDMCYNVGGMVIDEKKGTVVACKGITELPEVERKIFLDKGKEV